MADGQIIIETKLQDDGVKKGMQDIANQFKTVSASIEKTSSSIDKQKQKLQQLQQSYSKATTQKQKDNISAQMDKATASVGKLETKLNTLKDKQVNLKVKMDGANNIDSGFHSASESLTKDLDNVEKKAEEVGQKVSKSLNTKVDTTNSIQKYGESISNAGQKLSDFGSNLSTKVTLPIAGLATVSAKSAADFEHQMADIAKEVKAKGEDVNSVMSQMSSSSIKWSEDFGQSTTDINKGFLVLVKDGYSGAESMNIMNTALNTARGANEDLFTVIDQLGGSLEAYGQKTDNAAQTTANMSHMADTFAYISNHTKASISSLGEAFATTGQTAAALGQPMEQTAAAIGILQSSNIDASTAATSLKAGLVNLTKPTKNMQKAMSELGLQAFDSNGKMKDMATIIDDVNKGSKNMTDQQKQAAIAMLFGKESLASWNVLVGKGGDYLRNLATNAGNATGEVQELSDSMKNTPVNKMKEAEASFKALGITFGEDVLPAFTPIVNKVTEMLKSFASLDEGTKQEIIDFALLAASVGPVTKVFGTMTEGVGKLITFGGNVAKVLGLVETTTTAVGTATAGGTTAIEGGAVALGGLGIAGGTALAGIAALAVGVAAYATHQELMSKSINTSTDDLNTWQKLVNDCTGGVVKSKEELQQAGLVYQDFGEGVSDKFKSGIEKATKSYHDFEMALVGANSDDKITDTNSKKITDSINSMIESAKQTVTSRKSELQDELSKMFNLGDGKIDENEQKVIDAAGSEADAKLSKIDEIQKNITDRWNKAIQEHGKLSQDDIDAIKNYMKEIQQIQAETEAKNAAESSFAKNKFNAQLDGISADDAKDVYSKAADEISKKFADEKATYQTGIDDLIQGENEAIQKQKDAEAKGDKATAESAKNSAEEYKKQIQEKTKEMQDIDQKEYQQRREYLDMLYKKNPSLQNNMNEIDGSMFNTDDKNAQSRSEKLRNEFTNLANVTETGIKQVQDANGKWHDVYVTFDKATGNITGEFDTLTGEYGGYSAKFENEVKVSGEKIKAQIEELQKSLSFNGGGVKLDGDNNAINATTDQLITKLDNVVQKADGAKTAIQDINGTKVRLEFDKDGTLTNAQDVENAIQGKLTDNPAVVKTKIEVDGSQLSTIDDTEKKLKDLPDDKKVDISINGDEAIMTAKEAQEKLENIPKDEDVDITVNTDDADSKIDDTTQKAEDLGNEQPNVDATANTSDADNNLDTTKEKAEEVGNENPNFTVTANTGAAESALSRITSFLNGIAGRTVSAVVNVAENIAKSASDGTQTNYTGTNYLRTGLSTVNEHGWETAKNNNVKMLDNGLAFLIGHHYTGGDGINDHMTSVNEMNKEINDNVNNKFGVIVTKLINSLNANSTNQNNLLAKVATNTGTLVNNGNKSIQLNEKLATDIVNTANSNSTGNFSTLQNEINSANSAKEKADNMKVEDNYWYSSSKSQLDDVEAQIDALKDKGQALSDSLSDDASKSEKDSVDAEKKEIERQQHVLENQKDSLDKTVNYYKDAAQKEIDTCKEQAEQEVKIAEEKKDKLTKLADAVTTAIKNELTEQKTAAEKIINDELTNMETDYNNSVASIEADIKSKSDDIDQQIKDLEEESTDTSRDDTREEYNNKIAVLKAKMANTASQADKDSYALQIKDSKKELSKQEDSWDIEDEKAALEEEKNALSQSEENQKKTLENKYNANKKAKEKELKDTDSYYDKLLEEDSVNAQARYALLNSSNDDLVKLLNSYNPKWQDAGQSLADSLIDGLNSQKESVQDAIDDIMSYKNSDGATVKTGFNRSDRMDATVTGFATGTNSNPVAGLYSTNEKGFEMATSGDVAYVSQGAAIKNHMQTQSYIDSLVATEVSSLKASLIQSQQDTIKSMFGSMYGTNNNITNDYGNTIKFNIENYHQHTSQDAEALANEFNTLAFRQRRS